MVMQYLVGNLNKSYNTRGTNLLPVCNYFTLKSTKWRQGKFKYHSYCIKIGICLQYQLMNFEQYWNVIHRLIWFIFQLMSNHYWSIVLSKCKICCWPQRYGTTKVKTSFNNVIVVIDLLCLWYVLRKLDLSYFNNNWILQGTSKTTMPSGSILHWQFVWESGEDIVKS